jgi:hypothetical protein
MSSSNTTTKKQNLKNLKTPQAVVEELNIKEIPRNTHQG